MFNTPLLATFKAPLIVPPVQSMMAKPASAGMARVPELIITWSLALGTCCGVQLAELFQSLEMAPVQVMPVAEALSVRVAATTTQMAHRRFRVSESMRLMAEMV